MTLFKLAKISAYIAISFGSLYHTDIYASVVSGEWELG
jgi:hypothetical protein